jgi:branched-chain amino acid transport system ATP-binding protein
VAASTCVLKDGVALRLQSLRSGYGRSVVVRDVDLEIPAHSVVALLGPNGAGKTTLLKTVSGLIRPMAGSVIFEDKDVTSYSPHRRVGLGMCHIPEGRGIFRSLTVRQNIALQGYRGGEDQAIDKATAAFPILGERLQQRAGTLSGGQQQMLALARAYVQNPRLILVDEASLGLAPKAVAAIMDSLEQLAALGTSLLIVDQFTARALRMASTVYVINQGEIAFRGTPDELRSDDLFARYFGAA